MAFYEGSRFGRAYQSLSAREIVKEEPKTVEVKKLNNGAKTPVEGRSKEDQHLIDIYERQLAYRKKLQELGLGRFVN